MRQHVQPAAVRHPDDDLAQPRLHAQLHDRLQGGERRLAAVEAEALRSRVLLVQKLLERFGGGETLEDLELPLVLQARALEHALHPQLDPCLLVGVLQVHELEPHGSAVVATHHLHDFTHRRRIETQDPVQIDGPVHVSFGEAVRLRLQLRVRLFGGQPERIEVGLEVAPDAIGSDQHQGPHRVEGGGPSVAETGGQRWRRNRRSGRRGLRSVQRLEPGPGLVIQVAEQLAPPRLDRFRVLQVPAVQLRHRAGPRVSAASAIQLQAIRHHKTPYSVRAARAPGCRPDAAASAWS